MRVNLVAGSPPVHNIHTRNTRTQVICVCECLSLFDDENTKSVCVSFVCLDREERYELRDDVRDVCFRR